MSDSGRWSFEPLRRDHYPLLARWLATPHVAEWWHDDPAAVAADYAAVVDGSEPCAVFIALRGGEPAGLAQRYAWHAYPDYVAELAPLLALPAGAWSIDYFIGPPALLGRGHGRAMLEAFVQALWHDEPSATSVIVPTHAANRASWRALERIGFVRFANGELAPDNPAHDRRHVVLRIDRPAAPRFTPDSGCATLGR